MQHFLRSLTVTLALCCTNSFASPTTQDKLHNINKQITETQHELHHNQQHVTQLQAQLVETETKISTLQMNLENTNKTAKQLNKAVTETRKNALQLSKSREQQQDTLAQHLKANYLLGKKHPLKILLNNENPAHIERLNHYASILAEEQIESIKKLNTTEMHLALAKTNLDRKLAQLHTITQKQRKMKEMLLTQQRSRNQVMSKLNLVINHDRAQLQTLQANKARLESLLVRLQHSSTNHFKFIGKTFKMQSGHPFHWPLQGRIATDFGQVMKQTQVRSNGMIIAANAGTAVKSIAAGKVIFAEWLDGFGQLLIIDHGKGYMSLYGHNKALHKEVGQLVQASEQVASVGNSGGLDEPGLFFSVRLNGKAINPHACCQN